MAGFRQRDKRCFPLKRIDDVVDLVVGQLDADGEPDLTLISTVIGAVEASLTVNRAVERPGAAAAGGGRQRNCVASFPCVRLETAEALYQRFAVHVKGAVDLTAHDVGHSTRELVKRVSDVIWNLLARSYHKDKAHLQSIYSFLTDNKLDCYGVALATVAACQQLNRSDVHLALSEDHVWVVFGKDGQETAEVTWHGKGLEDKRGTPVTPGIREKSWLYLNNHPVICNRYTEVASIISAINPAINATTDSVEMAELQQKLLWVLYDRGHLEKYPLALGSLGELEDVYPSRRDVTPLDLFTRAVEASCKYYDNSHVNPYTYLGSYHYRNGNYKDALYNWAQAAKVISQYNHNREDEEIYKEFLEIANELIPNIIKVASENLHEAHLQASDTPVLQDPYCYSLILQFYDGICQWEEGSSTPVLHVGWAQHFVHSLSKFEEQARLGIKVEKDEDEEDSSSGSEPESGSEIQPKWQLRNNGMPERCVKGGHPGRNKVPKKTEKKNGLNESQLPVKRGRGRPPKRSSANRINNNNIMEKDVVPSSPTPCIISGNGYTDMPSPAIVSTDAALPEVESSMAEESDGNEDQIKSAIEELVSRVGTEVESETPNPNLAALAQACGVSILNPEYLINGGEPFAMTPSEADALFKDAATADPAVDDLLPNKCQSDNTESFMPVENGASLPKVSEVLNLEEAQIVPSQPEEDGTTLLKCDITDNKLTPSASVEHRNGDHQPRYPSIVLQLESAKMRGLKNLLLTRKLNGNAIKLQLTAQSQVTLKNSVNGGITRKRVRRE